MDQEHLKRVQAAGWHIETATESEVVAACPSIGCGLRARLVPGSHIPEVDPRRDRDIFETPISCADDVRRILRNRREALCLNQKEVAEIAGLEESHIAKLERDNSDRGPSLSTLFDWLASLGLEITARPAPLTAYALRIIAETRHDVPARDRRATVEQRRRQTKQGRKHG